MCAPGFSAVPRFHRNSPDDFVSAFPAMWTVSTSGAARAAPNSYSGGRAGCAGAARVPPGPSRRSRAGIPAAPPAFRPDARRDPLPPEARLVHEPDPDPGVGLDLAVPCLGGEPFLCGRGEFRLEGFLPFRIRLRTDRPSRDPAKPRLLDRLPVPVVQTGHPKGLIDLPTQVPDPPTRHAVLPQVRPFLDPAADLVDLRFGQTGIASAARAARQPLEALVVASLDSVADAPGLNATDAGRLLAARPVRDRRDRAGAGSLPRVPAACSTGPRSVLSACHGSPQRVASLCKPSEPVPVRVTGTRAPVPLSVGCRCPDAFHAPSDSMSNTAGRCVSGC